MILLDFSQILISSYFVNKQVLRQDIDEGMFRHITLNSILYYKKKFGKKYGDLIICNDSRHTWRKDVFPHYKANRKKTREDDKETWVNLFEMINTVRDEVRTVFPYKNMEVYGCEADDIIGVLATGFCQVEPIMIVSSDKDFMQLQKYPNIKQYSPLKKKELKADDPVGFLREHIIRGDSSDGVPNIKSDDDVFVTEGKRQARITQKFVDGYTIGSNDYLDNAQRNTTLIDLIFTPKELKDNILEAFHGQEVNTRKNLFNYFVKNKLKNLMSNIQDF